MNRVDIRTRVSLSIFSHPALESPSLSPPILNLSPSYPPRPSARTLPLPPLFVLSLSLLLSAPPSDDGWPLRPTSPSSSPFSSLLPLAMTAGPSAQPHGLISPLRSPWRLLYLSFPPPSARPSPAGLVRCGGGGAQGEVCAARAGLMAGAGSRRRRRRGRAACSINSERGWEQAVGCVDGCGQRLARLQAMVGADLDLGHHVVLFLPLPPFLSLGTTVAGVKCDSDRQAAE